MKRHINIPIFIPHLGCPNGCVFCNQRQISGKTAFDITAVEDELRRAVQTVDHDSCEVEIAFFGGSFTGIGREDMLYLLKLAGRYIDAGFADSVRISTRPDYIDEEILDILADHHVTDIELGLQSFDDRVLTASKRGHTAEISRRACRMITERGFRLVGQMMIGLPGSTPESERMTAREIVSLGCMAARIYPTVVFRDTELCAMMRDGRYQPLTLDDAAARSCEVLEIFTAAHIPVIRLGLCAADTLFVPGAIAGGAYHSAFGELVYSELYYRRIRKAIERDRLHEKIAGRTLTVHVPRGEVSKASGQKRANKLRLQNEYNVKNVKILENPDLIWYNIKLETE
ncbi:MAG: radical SAM protein [Ruminococcaceae bacterium]|nr:radical SAM protein [Oscillospiraceae bacterium]